MNKQLLASFTLFTCLNVSVHAEASMTMPTPTVNKSNVNAIATKPDTTIARPTQPIDCNYHISADTAKVDSSIVSQWAENAALRSFDFNDTNIDTRLGALKPCFTDQGWQSFNQALLQSGNIDAIKSQHLNVSAQRSGKIVIDANKENQWRITIPLQVVYQNDQQRLTQQLIVNLLVGRQISGDLGILQMIAAPQQTTSAPSVPKAAE